VESDTRRPGCRPRFVGDRLHALWITPYGVMKAALRNNAVVGTRSVDGKPMTTVAFRRARPVSRDGLPRRRPRRARRVAHPRSGAGRDRRRDDLRKLRRLRRIRVSRSAYASRRAASRSWT
jgi:hypothetical protein